MICFQKNASWFRLKLMYGIIFDTMLLVYTRLNCLFLYFLDNGELFSV